ncbi:hypothetical protein LOTGIDRAFT_112250 [Lottia gigantea]|uniref:Thioredoxin domain-containing protein n=1 Tax=Lottia gigantea TaxID=225164 RepID=V4CF46_LOTGI|nr:hypothetical protein LOTGIDRAFT_112250 [Lottia gigantea]ESP00625.1 hypothetical protein LOTGIDRAFT_112250 [Lottia gigantea]
MKISRGVRQETEVDELDLVSIGNQIVFDENGNKIKFGDVYKKQKTIIVFTRHLLCFMCKEYVEDLAVVPLEYLQDADVRIVVICPAPHKFIKPFRKVTGYNYSMYSDPDRNIYKAFGFKEKLTSTTLSKSKHVKSGFIMGVLSSTWRAMKVQEYQGDVKQQGGSLIIGPGNIIHYSHLDQNPTDHMAINDLLQISGVQTVSFPRDPRVIQV